MKAAAVLVSTLLLLAAYEASPRSDRSQASLPATGNHAIVFLGDSLTENWFSVDRDYMAAHHYRYVNAGVSGETTEDLLARFHSDVVKTKPRIVHIWVGTNDITNSLPIESVESNLAKLHAAAAQAGALSIVVSVLPMRGEHAVHNPNVVALNSWLQRFAASHGLIYLDYYSLMVDDKGELAEKYAKSDIHINAAGYAVLTPVMQAAVDKLGGGKQ
jgi:lysophospholipase L1-like esterase